jgi:hypothetical protein
MPKFGMRVGMNRPTVNNPEVVRDILEQYVVRPELRVVTGSEAGTGVLAFAQDFADLPSAFRYADWPPGPGIDEDEEAWFEAYEKLHEELGEQGLTDLLLALAPHLTTPLVLQVAFWESDGTYFAATDWAVRPGATEVEVEDIRAMDDEYSLVSCD